MKEMTGLLIILVLVSGCAFSTIGNFSGDRIDGEKNIVNNSSFETKTSASTNIPDNWLILDGDDEEILLVDNSGSRNGKCLEIKRKDGSARLVSDSFEIDSQCVYFTRCFVRSTGQNDCPVTLHFFAFDENGYTVNDFKKEMIIKGEWKPIEITTGFFNNSAISARLTISIPKCPPETAFWLDDVESFNVHKFAYRYQVN